VVRNVLESPATQALVVTALYTRGAEGTVMDGAARDIDPMIEMGFPVFAASVSPVNFTGKAVVDRHDIPIVCGGVGVQPGDVILAEWDGVVAIPQQHAAAVLEKAAAVEAAERAMREQTRADAPTKPVARIFVELEQAGGPCGPGPDS
jgi:4-hydroxy-4-methyl-2-oxoglutarate aldolase